LSFSLASYAAGGIRRLVRDTTALNIFIRRKLGETAGEVVSSSGFFVWVANRATASRPYQPQSHDERVRRRQAKAMRNSRHPRGAETGVKENTLGF
jgi:hypothetical protein